MSESITGLLIRGTRVSSTATQKTIVISYSVPNVTDPSDALNEIAALIPVGTPCTFDSLCLATNYDSESFDQSSETVCRVNVTFIGFSFYGSTVAGGPLDQALAYAYNAALGSDQTNLAFGTTTALAVYWWDDPSNIGTPSKATITNGATIPVLKPYTVKTVSFFMIATELPSAVVASLKSNIGYTNTDTWDGGAPDTWLAMNVTATPVGLPTQLRVDCVFQYKPEKWYAWAFVRDGSSNPLPGQVKDPSDPTQASTSNGCAGFLPYGAVSFASTFGFN